MNPRLSPEWLLYLASVGAREDDDGWRWKIDPTMRFGGFGPWRPEWTVLKLPGLPMPFLAVLGRQPEEMGWGTDPEQGPPVPAARTGGWRSSTTPVTSSTSSSPSACRSVGARPRREEHLMSAHDVPRAQPHPPRPAPPPRGRGTAAAVPPRARRGGAGDRADVARRLDRARSPRSTSPATASRRSPSAAATRPRSCSPTPTSPSPRSARRRSSGAASAPSSR